MNHYKHTFHIMVGLEWVLEWKSLFIYVSESQQLEAKILSASEDEGNGQYFCWRSRCCLPGRFPWVTPSNHALHLAVSPFPHNQRQGVCACGQHTECLQTGSCSYSSALSLPQNESPDSLKCLIILWLIDGNVAPLLQKQTNEQNRTEQNKQKNPKHKPKLKTPNKQTIIS